MTGADVMLGSPQHLLTAEGQVPWVSQSSQHSEGRPAPQIRTEYNLDHYRHESPRSWTHTPCRG